MQINDRVHKNDKEIERLASQNMQMQKKLEQFEKDKTEQVWSFIARKEKNEQLQGELEKAKGAA